MTLQNTSSTTTVFQKDTSRFMTKQRCRKGSWSAGGPFRCWSAWMVQGSSALCKIRNDPRIVIIMTVLNCELYICFRSCSLLVENAIVLPEETMVTGQWGFLMAHVTPMLLVLQFFVFSVCHLVRWHLVVRATDPWYGSVLSNSHVVWFCNVQYPQTIPAIELQFQPNCWLDQTPILRIRTLKARPQSLRVLELTNWDSCCLLPIDKPKRIWSSMYIT